MKYVLPHFSLSFPSSTHTIKIVKMRFQARSRGIKQGGGGQGRNGWEEEKGAKARVAGACRNRPPHIFHSATHLITPLALHRPPLRASWALTSWADQGKPARRQAFNVRQGSSFQGKGAVGRAGIGRQGEEGPVHRHAQQAVCDWALGILRRGRRV